MMISSSQFSTPFPFSGPRASPTYAPKPYGMVVSPKQHRLNSNSSPCASRKADLSSSAISICVNPEARSLDVKQVDPLLPSKMLPMLPSLPLRDIVELFSTITS